MKFATLNRLSSPMQVLHLRDDSHTESEVFRLCLVPRFLLNRRSFSAHFPGVPRFTVFLEFERECTIFFPHFSFACSLPKLSSAAGLNHLVSTTLQGQTQSSAAHGPRSASCSKEPLVRARPNIKCPPQYERGKTSFRRTLKSTSWMV